MASVVQALVANGSNPASSVAAAFGSNVTAGSRILVATFIGASVSHVSTMVTDTLSNTYALDFEFASAAGDLVFFSAPSPSGGANTVTYNPGSSARIGIVIMEVSGIDAYAGSQTSTNSGTSASPSSGAITPAAANGIAYSLTVANGQETWESDYSTGAVFNSTGRVNGAYKLISATSSENAEGTFGGSIAWNAMIIRYPDTAAGGVVGPLLAGHLTHGGILAGRLVGH